MRRRSAPLAHEGEKVKPQHGIALVLLIALISGAAAAGDLPPALPHEFYGNVAIDGSPAPAGTIVTAMIGDTGCGSILVTDAGRYGDHDWNLGNRLLVTGTSEQSGEAITFSAGGVAARETAVFMPGGVTRLDLSFEETVATPTARFQTNITSGPAPLTIQFTDTSLGNLDSREWNFGDGANSTEINPVHTYTEPGTYTATLTVANAAGSTSATATIIVQEAGAVDIVRGPYLTGTTTTATFVNWMTQEPVAGTVEYADDAYYAANGRYENFVADTAETAFHRVALENLTPDTLYHYRIVAGNTTLDDHTFRTFPEDGGFTFIVYGDTQIPANIKIVADRIADEDPLFVLHTGDQVNGVESVDEWNDFFRNSGRMLANTTIYTTMGNHEKNHTAYYENFGLPQRYSFTCSDAQFTILDDNNWVDLDRESAWLEEDLDSDAAWKFVAHHHPPYSSTPDRTGGWILLRAWGETMRDAGVSAVFNGHIHAYERYLVDDINYVVAGTGAGPLYRLGDEKPEGYQTSLEDTLGYTKITLHPNGTTVADFVRVARLSEENSVLEVYPPGSVFETYTMTRPPRADLAAVSLTPSGNITAGAACTVTGTVENIGDAASRACSAVLTVGDLEIGTAAVGTLGPGETTEVSFTWIPAAAGDATLTLVVDPDAAIPDVNRKNNNLTTTVAIAGSDPGHAPVADFTADVTSGVAPLTVTFTDASTGADSWAWTFGDGGTSDQPNPVHTYTAAGVYTVSLTATNSAGSDFEEKTNYITVTEPEPGNIEVTSTPAGAAIWLDGEDTSKVTPITLENVPAGDHVVTLKLAGYADASKEVTIVSGETATVSLALTTLTGSLEVTSTPAGATIFIDGAGTGKVTNTTIDGIAVGTHTITVKREGYADASTEVTIADGETSTVHFNLVLSALPPVAGFTAAPTDGVVPLAVQFTDASTNATAWAWTFGDGGTSDQQNPTHTYTAIGRYNVTLTVTNIAGSDTLTRQRYISVRDLPSEPARNETGYPLHDNGTTVTTVGGQQQVTFNATAGNGNVSGNDIHLATGTLNVTIQTDGLTEEGGNLTGIITGVLLESSQPATADLDDLGNVSIAFNASMNGYNPNLTISTSIYEQPSGQASTAFTLAAADGNLEITSTAYAVYFTKTNLGENDTISNAVLRMTVSPAWVEANGGVDAIRVFRQGDDGVVSILATTYLGLDGDGMMVFEAVSPDGFSSFAVVATKAVATPTPPRTSSGGRGTATVTSTGTADLLTASWGGVLRPYLVYVDGNSAYLSLETGVTALDDAGSPLSGVGITPVSTLPGASSLAFSGYAVDCSPAGATFSPAIDLVFTFTAEEWAALLDTAGGDATRLAVQRYDAATGAWTACPTSVDAAAGTVTASVSHFSTYALFVEESAEEPVPTGPTEAATTPAGAATTAPPVPPAETGESPLVWIALAVIIVAALAGYLLWKRR